jgi:hypothetical protein
MVYFAPAYSLHAGEFEMYWFYDKKTALRAENSYIIKKYIYHYELQSLI